MIKKKKEVINGCSFVFPARCSCHYGVEMKAKETYIALVKERDATVLSETFVNTSTSSQISAARCAGRREHYVMMEHNKLCIDYKRGGGAQRDRENEREKESVRVTERERECKAC